jgi:hypothetical protein
MSTLTELECLIANARARKVFIIILHTLQVTQAMSLPKAKPKLFFYITCDQPTPSMVIVLFVHALPSGRVVSI